MSLTIRPAVRTDAEQILAFITELAEYERARHEVVATLADIEHSLFDEGSTVRSLMCERDGRAVGFAVYFYSYSTWLGRNGIYLEDLYVTPEQRGDGAGRQLLRHIAREAVANNCGRLEWSVLDWNEPAIGFYQKLGAEAQDEWVRYRLDGEKLAAFARSYRDRCEPEGKVTAAATLPRQYRPAWALPCCRRTAAPYAAAPPRSHHLPAAPVTPAGG